MNSNELSNSIRASQKIAFFVFFLFSLSNPLCNPFFIAVFFAFRLVRVHYPYSLINDSLLETLTEEIEKRPAL
jgi:hypothetical protein